MRLFNPSPRLLHRYYLIVFPAAFQVIGLIFQKTRLTTPRPKRHNKNIKGTPENALSGILTEIASSIWRAVRF